MAKQNEIDYLGVLAEGYSAAEVPAAIEAHRDKPFGFGSECGSYLMDLGSIMRLLPAPPARILDLGVGVGWTSVFYSRNGYEVVGQDIAPTMIELAEKNREWYRAERLRFVVSDYESLGMDGEFDCAVFYDSLHHAVDDEAALRAVFRALKPGGTLVTLEPGEGHATSLPTLRVVEKYGTTEKDMPPHRILEVGNRVGFRSGAVYSRAYEPSLLYDQDSPSLYTKSAADPRGKWRRGGSLALAALRVIAGATVPKSHALKTSNLVVLRKPA